ncbi:MAG: TAXI family TRAP transporter solute-binding subunit [Proteobacteria bacterium]|nr:TAXI family TRAP transporter solute-binding subunit [Pseudomonadota bacterium]
MTNTRHLPAAAILTLALGLIFGLVARPAAADSKPDTLRFLSGTSGGPWYPIVVGLSEILTKAGARTTTEVGAGNSNIINISKGAGDLGFAPTPAAASAAMGEAPFPSKITNVRGLFKAFDSLIELVATKDSGIKAIPDLKGRKVALQEINAGVTPFFRMMLATYGMSEDNLSIVMRGGAGQAMAAVQDRRADFFLQAGPYPSSATSQLAATRPVTLLSVDEAHFKELLKLNGGFTRETVRGGAYRGQDADFPGVFFAVFTIANETMPDDHAYWVVKTIVQHLGEVQKFHKMMEGLSAKGMANFAGAPMHPGAVRYYKEAGAL